MMHVETFVPGNRRSTLELIRCRTEDGTTEFAAEVKRIEKIRAEYGEDWETVRINLLWGETVFSSKEIP